MAKEYTYSESSQILDIAKKLKGRYIHVVGYVELDKIFFAFKGGDISEDFTYEMQGLKSDWVKQTQGNASEAKVYCIAMSYDFFTKAEGPLLEWTLLECLYSCHPKMDGKMRRKDVHEFSRIHNTLNDLECSREWRKNTHLPSLLGDETIVFGLSDDEPI